MTFNMTKPQNMPFSTRNEAQMQWLSEESKRFERIARKAGATDDMIDDAWQHAEKVSEADPENGDWTVGEYVKAAVEYIAEQI